MISTLSDLKSCGVEWDSVTWDRFGRALLDYRDAEYRGRSSISGENAYLLIFAELADVPLAEHDGHLDSLGAVPQSLGPATSPRERPHTHCAWELGSCSAVM